MSKRDKLLELLKNSPNNARFNDICKLLELSREAQLFVGWVSGSVTHAGVGFHGSTQPTFILYLIPPTYLEGFSLDRITGSHHIFKRNDIILVIPVHNKKVKSVYIRRVLEIIGDN